MTHPSRLLAQAAAAVLFGFALALPARLTAWQGNSQSYESRIVLGTDVACRVLPERGAPVVTALHPGDAFSVAERTDGADDRTWYRRVEHPVRTCWVFGALSVVYDYQDHDGALLAIAEHALQLGDEATFEHLLRVDNLVLERDWRGHADDVTPIPPLLELRHLEIVDRAARLIQPYRDDPIVSSWVLGRRNLLGGPEIVGRYFVHGSAFWDLFERHRESEMAEAFAWSAIRHEFGGECESDATCFLGRVAQSPQRYWSAFPEGAHIQEVLDRGHVGLRPAARYACGQQRHPAVPRESVEAVRRSLERVVSEGKQPLLELLDVVDEKCGR